MKAATAAFSIVALVSIAGCSATPRTHGFAYTNGQWFDGQRFEAATVYAVDGRLTRTAPGVIDTTIDLAGGWVVPPFAEAHNHNVESSRFARVNEKYLREGIFYIKNPNSLERFTAPIRDSLGTPQTIDAVFSGGGLTSAGGHPIEIADRMIGFGRWSDADGEGGFYWTIDDTDELAARWDSILAGDPDFIKTYLMYSEDHTARMNDPDMYGARGLEPTLLPRIVELAHAAGLRVSAHVETGADFHVAVEAGVDEVNHLPGFRPELDVPIDRYRIAESDAGRAAEKGIVVVTTVSALIETIEAMPPEEAAVAARYRELVMANLETLSRNGVKIAIGSDRYEKSSLDEALALSRLGVWENAELLQRWTRETARTIFPDREIGCLGEGCEASFLVLDANPLEEFEAVERIRMRVKQGVEVELSEAAAAMPR